MNLIAIQIAAHPTGRNPWYDVPWNEILLNGLDIEIASARSVALGYTLVLTVEAALITLRVRQRRRFADNEIPPTGGLFSLMYLFTFAVATVLNPVGPTWRGNDNHDLAVLCPAWYMPALIGIGLVALIGLTVWLTAAIRDVPAAS
ncbi:hypothetical protein HCN51_55620 [Nonomuraea sp. FMUSA5-5]|uniref:Uncharacterized protein n=1 Tax=Nonomuraea composti TaxID=2720023 RepID=A0ABX1BRP6_9ACTN|nr:hypothetical protein [Nonomuraea sp. FMUSA5-5]NJP98554.1 hypothetical protein [Nonomuraea sp. FMUSA5-5]